ncbi:TPM domain-containing protein [Massilia cavernae]|uniref:TPM domain-containing protein n=1 Tax=Massilia cavernae TaxID=2320864 RepID=A0A418Y742_9BURK|nr:TPM domain-containing protein [Massilia cavernae]RJG25064.1 TPM domain-containing protein [Massilia cavernae]
MAGSFVQTLRRALRHLRTTAAVGREAFPTNSLADLGAAITEGERSHRGELRLIVENSMPFDAIWDGMTNRQRALGLFAEYGVWDTEDNCGVLIYVNLAEHKVDIVCDRAIGRKIGAPTWQAVCQTMTQGFARGEFHDSTLAAIRQVNALLHQHFPAGGERNDNELPDHPVVL